VIYLAFKTKGAKRQAAAPEKLHTDYRNHHSINATTTTKAHFAQPTKRPIQMIMEQHQITENYSIKSQSPSACESLPARQGSDRPRERGRERESARARVRV